MTRETMMKLSFKPYMKIMMNNSNNPRKMEPVEMFLLAIDFDFETMKLQPINPDFQPDEIIVSIALCELPMRAKKGNLKSV